MRSLEGLEAGEVGGHSEEGSSACWRWAGRAARVWLSERDTVSSLCKHARVQGSDSVSPGA